MLKLLNKKSLYTSLLPLITFIRTLEIWEALFSFNLEISFAISLTATSEKRRRSFCFVLIIDSNTDGLISQFKTAIRVGSLTLSIRESWFVSNAGISRFCVTIY